MTRKNYIEKCFFKKNFPDEASASKTLTQIKKSSRVKAEIFANGGVYQCPYCDTWHITKNLQDREQKQEIDDIQLEAEYWKGRLT